MRQAPSDHGERRIAQEFEQDTAAAMLKHLCFPECFSFRERAPSRNGQVGTAGDRNSLKNKDTQEIEADIKY